MSALRPVAGVLVLERSALGVLRARRRRAAAVGRAVGGVGRWLAGGRAAAVRRRGRRRGVPGARDAAAGGALGAAGDRPELLRALRDPLAPAVRFGRRPAALLGQAQPLQRRRPGADALV